MTRTIFLIDLCVPLMAITAEHRYAMGPVRDAGPPRAPELPQSSIRGDRPENIKEQEATEDHQRWPRHGVYPHGEIDTSRRLTKVFEPLTFVIPLTLVLRGNSRTSRRGSGACHLSLATYAKIR